MEALVGSKGTSVCWHEDLGKKGLREAGQEGLLLHKYYVNRPVEEEWAQAEPGIGSLTHRTWILV